MSFLDSIHCRSRAHCRLCRDGKLTALGAPVDCPHGMDGPGLVEKLKNFTHAAAGELHAAATGKPPVTPEEAERRLGICGACEWQIDGECRKCGCRLKKKTAWRNERCPVGKW